MKNEIVQAIIELKQAEQNFQYADEEFVEVAIHQLRATECKVNLLLALRLEEKKKADSLVKNPLKIDWLKKLSIDSIPQKRRVIKRKIKTETVNVGNIDAKHLMTIGKNF
ncbi:MULTISPECIES: hypothetical protein [Clostridium]|uniref:Uncharacterized protein n=1 Tax=Clostridium frigoriphilum TaxID=443253 RepID=A0ABU7UIT3_9CLOT|nr:hypothetical protein [Clostridium sp. DSM 17811]MBU3098352.1 hypothetical protein [Clostridium sp. DSM 17811]